MADLSLDQVNGGAAVQHVADVGVAEPMRRHPVRQVGPLGRALDDAMHLAWVQRAVTIPRAEHHPVRVRAAQPSQVGPDTGLEHHHPGLAPLAEHRHGSVKNLGRYAASWIAWWPNRPSSTAALT